MKKLEIINPKTGEIVKDYEALVPEQKSDLLSDVNFYQRSMKKIEDFIKNDIKEKVSDEINEDNRDVIFGHHKVSLVSRPFFNKSKMTEEEKKVFSELESKYSEMKSFLVIK